MINITKRELESMKKKRYIVGEAIKLFIKKGYGNTKISDISRVTGFSVGSLYNYFGTKAGILSQSIREIYHQASREMIVAIERGIEPKEVILSYYRSIAVELHRYGKEMTRAAYEAASDQAQESEESVYYTITMQTLMDYLQGIKRKGRWSMDLEVEEVAEQIQTQYFGTVCTWMFFPSEDPLFDLVETNLSRMIDNYGLFQEIDEV